MRKAHTTFEIVQCANCGIDWGMPKHLLDQRRKDGKGFNCPNGHGNVYTASTLEAKLAAVTAERDALKTEILQLKHKMEQAGIF